MSARAVRGFLPPSQGYICLSCRLQNAGVRRGQTRNYSYATNGDSNGSSKGSVLPKEIVESTNASSAGSRSFLKDMIRDLVRGRTETEGTSILSENKTSQDYINTPHVETEQTKESNPVIPKVDDTQERLQRKFATQRRKDLLAMQNKQTQTEDEEPKVAKEPKNQEPVSKPSSRSKVNAKKKLKAKSRADKRKVKELESHAKKKITPASSPSPADVGTRLKEAPRLAQKKPTNGPGISQDSNKAPLTEAERKARLVKSLKPLLSKAESAPTPGRKKRPQTKTKLRDRSKEDPDGSVRKVQSKPSGVIRVPVAAPSSRQDQFSSEISNAPGFDSLESALSSASVNARTDIEKADATLLEIRPIMVEQAPVPKLSYDLERVLFNPGIYQLQDPRSRVYNFDPYLQKIMPVAEFDFNSLKEYITSSRDESLKRIAKAHSKRYMGSTSSMTAVLSHFHFLLSQWRPIDTSMLSKAFPTPLSSFTELSRTPSAIFLRWKDGSYAIDADKQFDSANVLSMLGRSMEKLLTLETEDFERYRKSSPGQVSDEKQSAPETYHYSTMGDFLMRSQLDAHDPRLPGTGMFDLKTRAVVSIRMDVTNYEQGVGYEIKSRQGEFESYEREYYDMIRAAFLKYSMQVRMGRMDGIFVAFHNVERIFGFQYISLPEMDSTIHGQWDTTIGDQEFKLSLELLNKALNKATEKFPETSIRLHFETRDASTPFMYIFAEPVTEEQVAQIQSRNATKIEDFERKILGLTRGDDPESQDAEEDDFKWKNIQADVQDTMDKDELSVEQPAEEDANGHDLEDSEVLANQRGVANRSIMNASDEETQEDDEAIAMSTASADNQLGDEIDEDDELGDTAQDNEGVDQHNGEDLEEYDGEELDELIEKADEGEGLDGDTCEEVEEYEGDSGGFREPDQGNEDRELEGDDEGEIRNEEEGYEEAEIDSHEENGQATDQSTDTAVEEIHEIRDAEREKELLQTDLMDQTTPPVNSEEVEAEEQIHGHVSPLPGDEQADPPTSADMDFLNDVKEELAYTENTAQSPEILAMTLTIRNKVNNKFVLRPERLTAKDRWSIEYSLSEVTTESRARALYKACQNRRKKKHDKMEAGSDEERLNTYLLRLRELSEQGRRWRARQDSEDTKKPVQILGGAVVEKAGESGVIKRRSDD